MPRTPLRLVLTTLAAAALLVGCGTSGGDDAADTTTTEKSAVTTTDPGSDTTETTTDDSTDTTEVETTEAEGPTDGGDEICAPLKVLSDFDIDSAELINSGDWPATQAFFVESTDDVLAAYDDAIAMDTDLADELEALRGVTETTAETAADSTDLMDFSSKLLAQPGIMEAGTAGFTLNEFAEENCGFSTGGNGQ